MGSLVISDVVSDFTRFPHTMLGGHVAQQSTTESPRRTPSSTYPSQSSGPTLADPPPAPTTTPVATPSADSAPRLTTTSAASNASQLSSSSSRHTPLSSAEISRQSSAHNATRNKPRFESRQQIPDRIKVRDLSHIQSFASEALLSPQPHVRLDDRDVRLKYEISAMPVTDVIEMVAGLLTKITSTNDRQHEHLHHHIPPPEGTTGLSQQTTSVLAFHGKNVPSITIQSYLSRIHKYCPTTYEVFLSLLVYFDRMTERVNSEPMQSLRVANDHLGGQSAGEDDMSTASSETMVSESSPVLERIASNSKTAKNVGAYHEPGETASPFIVPEPSAEEEFDLSHFFVVDSFNIHRLVIAGVTCASKFFSDVFYTNSRYAKVGGLPLPELNHLELQFLLLNDFRLSVPVEELEAYGTMLVEFYARETIAQRQGDHSMEGIYTPGAGFQTPIS